MHQSAGCRSARLWLVWFLEIKTIIWIILNFIIEQIHSETWLMRLRLLLIIIFARKTLNDHSTHGLITIQLSVDGGTQ